MKAIEKRIMRAAPVIPVLVVHDVKDAYPLAEQLVAGGLPVLEVTLRTDCALEAIRQMKKVKGAIVGAGTVTNEDQLHMALDAGSEFIVSPGLTEPLGKAAIDNNIPFLPGVASAGDIMRGLDMGLEHFKFFPAEASGGIKALKSLAGPFSHVKFCPTGGINANNVREWLQMEPVLCVGGSWLVTGPIIDREEVKARALVASQLTKA